MKYFIGLFTLIGLLTACQNDSKLAAFEETDGVFLVEIQTPAGQTDNHTFLPSIGNLGQVSTNPKAEILVLSESAEKGTKIPVQPIGTLILRENKQIRYIVIASPIDSTRRLSSTTNFQQFITVNAGEKQIIQDWFLYQKGLGKTELVGWEDEQFAKKLLSSENP